MGKIKACQNADENDPREQKREQRIEEVIVLNKQKECTKPGLQHRA